MRRTCSRTMRGGGRIVHAVKAGCMGAVCGVQPGRTSGWSKRLSEPVTCKRCAKTVSRWKAERARRKLLPTPTTEGSEHTATGRESGE